MKLFVYVVYYEGRMVGVYSDPDNAQDHVNNCEEGDGSYSIEKEFLTPELLEFAGMEEDGL